MKNLLTNLTLLFIAISISYSQQIRNDLSLIPPSPEMATLGSYGGYGVDHYTGRANVSIPIYEIKLSDFTLPISLSYNTGGHRVEEIATWVGLGWSLNAGGMISRQVRGLPDDQGSGYMHELIQYTAKEVIDLPSNLDKDHLITAIYHGDFDTEPDIFHFGFAGHSGSFYFNQENRNIVFVPMDNYWVDLDYFIAENKWKIIDQSGTEYHFDLKETNQTFVSCNGGASSPDLFTSGWFLTKIITPIERTEIYFHYTSVYYQVQNISTHKLNSGNGTNSANCINQITRCDSYNQYNGFVLSSIEWNNKRIEFEALTERLDLPSTFRLDKIKIYEDLLSVYKTYHLDYEYNHQNPEGLDHLRLRLKLKSVTEEGLNGAQKPPYTFDYDYSVRLPSRLSYAQDIWGFYNGENSNTHLVPPLQNKAFSILRLNDGANRNVDPLYTKAEVLKSITYPTGGQTVLEYENHEIAAQKPPAFIKNNFLVSRGAHVDINDRVGTSEKFESPVFWINDATNEGVEVRIRTDGVFNCSYCPTASVCAVFTLQAISDPSESFTITCDMDDYFLPNGPYRLKADFGGNNDPNEYAEFVLQMNWMEDQSPQGLNNYQAGGLRIAGIRDIGTDQSDIYTQYDYSVDDRGISSGQTLRKRGLFERVRSCVDDLSERSYIERSSYPLLPLSSQKSPVVYAKVSTSKSSTFGAGKSVYEYSFTNDFVAEIDVYSGSTVFLEMPFIAIDQEYRRGLLIKESHFEHLGLEPSSGIDNFRIISKREIDYTHTDNRLFLNGEFDGEPTSHDGTFGVRTDMTISGLPGAFAEARAYKVLSEFIKPKQEILTTYENGKELKTIKSYSYENSLHRLPTTITTTRSDGKENVQHITYPFDFEVPQTSTNNRALGIKTLQDARILDQPIEIIHTLKDPISETEQFLHSSVQLFDENQRGNTAVQTKGSSISHTPIYIDASGKLIWDGDYELDLSLLRDQSTSKILETRKKDGIVNSYIWGYNEEVIIGIVEGIPYDQLTIPASIKSTFNPNTIDTFMDELRDDFPKASITSFIYTNDLKLSAQTDPNGIEQHYEYDDFRRLKAIRNNNQEVLRSFDYFYKQND